MSIRAIISNRRRRLGLPDEKREKTSGHLSGSVLNDLVQQGLREEGKITGPSATLTVLSTVHATHEELLYAQTYRAGQVLTVTRHNASRGLARGTYEVLGHGKGGLIRLQHEQGKLVQFRPAQIDPNDRRDLLQLSERETVNLQAGNRIRWTASDKARSIFNSDGARVVGISPAGIEVELASKSRLILPPGDRMLEHLGLVYAITCIRRRT